jgi:membrane associated rhomboid family serine protease
MFPIKTEKPVFSRPVLTGLVIAANLAVFLAMRSGGEEAFQRRIFEYGLVPAALTGRGPAAFIMVGADPVGAVNLRTGEVTSYDFSLAETRLERAIRDVPAEALLSDEPFPLRVGFVTLEAQAVRQRVPAWLTPLTSMFMHAGWLHLLGNLWFLWLFGTAVEDFLGRGSFLVFYLATGLAATAAHVADDVGSLLPCLGASGAISGVMGGFLILFPRARVLALGPLVMGGLIPLPAFLFLGFYLLEQVFMSVRFAAEGGGVAWWAHIGGFIAGVILVRLLPPNPAWVEALARRRPSRDRFGYDYEPKPRLPTAEEELRGY